MTFSNLKAKRRSLKLRLDHFSAYLSLLPHGQRRKTSVQRQPLKLFEKFTRRAGDEHSARDASLAVFYALHDAGDLAALGAIGALGGVHDLLAVTGFGNLRHWLLQI